MKVKRVVILFCVLFSFFTAWAQEEQKNLSLDELQAKMEKLEKEVSLLKKLTVSGYIQGQYQYGEEDASLKVGSSNEKPGESFSRIGIRRGRLKLVYEEGIASGTFQIDLTEKGIGLKDVYLNIKDPWFRTNALRGGIFNRPFGYEISYSSTRRESPERSTIFQTLFPEERDLGLMLILQPAESSPLHFLKLEAGLFAGNGIKEETDSKKDFIGHLSATKSFNNGLSFGLGFSHYNGFVYQGTENVYKMEGDGFVLSTHTSNRGEFARREYYGFDAQISLAGLLGKTHLRGEYVLGQQPGTATGTRSPNSSSLPTADTYIRNFRGGYLFFVQDIGKSPFAAVVKYDWYDPNTKVSGDHVGLNETTETDLALSTWGVGTLWYINKALHLQAYYEFNNNEKTSAIEGRNENIKDDVFTLRLQYKF